MCSLRAGLAVAVLGALLGGGTIVAADAPAPLEIDVLVPQTGPAAFIGKSGTDTLTALQATVNKNGGVRGRPVKFVFYDDQSNPQQAVQLTNGLIAKKVSVILGPAFTATCRAIIPLLGAGPVDYCLSPGIAPAPGSYTFSAGPSSRDLALILYRYASLRGWKRISTIYSTDATGQDAEKNTNELLKGPEFKDVTLVDAEHFNPTDLDISAQMARIKAAQPQMIVGWTSGTPFGTVLRGISQAGLTIPVLTSSANLSVDQLRGYGAIVPKELYLEGSPSLLSIAANAAMKRMQGQFVDAMHAAGAHIDASSGTTWDVGALIVEALRQIGPDATPDQIRAYLAGVSGYAGAAGVYDFPTTPQRGLTERDLVVMRFDPDKLTLTQMSRLGGEPLR